MQDRNAERLAGNILEPLFCNGKTKSTMHQKSGKQTAHTNTDTQTHTAKSANKSAQTKPQAHKHKPEREGAKLVAA